jgi:hypothetical protein
VAAAILWTVVAGVYSRWYTAAVLCAVAGLLRPDAYLIIIPLGIMCVYDLKKTFWKPALTGFLISLPWYIFALIYFGTVIPQTAVAKVHTASLSEYWIALVHYVSVNLVVPRIIVSIPSFIETHYAPWFLTLVAAAVWLTALFGIWCLLKGNKRLWILPACMVLYCLAYLFLLRAYVGFEWHLYPVMLFLGVFFLTFIAQIPYLIKERHLRAMVIIFVFGYLLLFYGNRTIHNVAIHQNAFWFGARHKVYQEVADYLRQHSEETDVVLVEEVGTIAYYSQLPVLDAYGLVSRNPMEKLARGLVKPRWVIVVPLLPGMTPPPDPEFQARSKPVNKSELHPVGKEYYVTNVYLWEKYQQFLTANQ